MLLFFFLLFKSALFRVKKLTCFLNESRCSPEIWGRVFSAVVDQPVIFLSENYLVKTIKENYPQIKAVKVKIIFPRTLRVDLTEYKPIALLRIEKGDELVFPPRVNLEEVVEKYKKDDFSPDSFWVISEEGVVLKKASSKTSLPRVFLKTKEENEMHDGLDLNQFSWGVSLPVLNLLAANGLDFELVIGEEETNQLLVLGTTWQALFSLEKEIGSQVGSLQLILSRAKIEGKLPRLVDLRFDKPVISF